MNRPQRPHPNNQRRGQPQQRRRPTPVDIWRAPAPLPDAEPIVVASDVGALIRSLGDPPMNGSTAGHYFETVAERAAAIAAALALSADLLAEPEGD